jgi:primosomal protein N' (replication factor Y)
MQNNMNEEEKYIAEVIPAIKLPGNVAYAFSYEIPAGLRSAIRIGSVVRIPFRRQEVLGVVESFSPKSEAAYELKKLGGVETALSFSESQLQLARFISDCYLTPLNLLIKMMLPTVPKKEARTGIRLDEAASLPTLDAQLEKSVLEFTDSHERTLLLHRFGPERHALYAQLIARQPESAQTLLLLPEYFDLYAYADRYIKKFGRDRVALLCSGITKNQFYAEWQKVQSGAARVVIGTRQSVFAPFTRLDLIIIDDEHNSSYKQWDQNPRYHGVTAALELAAIHRSRIVLSSPCPSLESFQRTKEDFALLDLTTAPTNWPRILDFEIERKMGNYSYLSEALKDNLLEKIYAKKQALIFIPRLGQRTMHQCKDCGYIAECPVCQSALIGFKDKLYCPRCKQLSETLSACPKCHGQNIKAGGGGSSRVFDELNLLFENKNINIVELDSSTSDDSGSNQKIYADFQHGKIDILVGTQMIWKNWNMPRLELVAAILPEIIFGSPGFRSRERSWQFLAKLYQYAQDKEMFVETYKPEHKYLIEFKEASMVKFLEAELEARCAGLSRIPYPPFGRLIKLVYKHPDACCCEKEARWRYEQLKQKIYDGGLKDTFEVMPPFAAQNYREYGKYRWHLILRCKRDADIAVRRQLLFDIIKNWIVDIDPDEIL